MSSHPTVPAADSRSAVDLRHVPWIRRLAVDYTFEYGRVAEFFSGSPAAPADWREAIARAQRHGRPREAIVEVVRAQQRQRGAPPAAIAAAGRLADPRSVAIVTGQQAGLFGGPLFTLLKAITALRLADQIGAASGVPVVPVFWVDADDHDWDEVRTCGVFDRDARLQTIAVADPPGARTAPIGRLVLDASAGEAIDRLEAALPATEYTPALIADLRRAYRPGARMSEAFGQWLESVLGHAGLVVYDASDPAAKPLAAGVFAREVERAGETSRLAADAGAALAARGYHVQVAPQPGSLALFDLSAGREPIRRDETGFRIGDRMETPEALLHRVRETPEAFSPNVLLRPIVQDTIFPTAATVAGPSELAYLAQLGGVYRAFGVPMPIVQVRLTATLLDAGAMRFLARHDVPFASLRAQDEAALNDLLAAQLPAAVDAAVQEARRTIDARMGDVAAAVQQIDVTLEGAARSTLGRMQDDLKKLQGKVIQAAKRRDETLRRQFHHAQAQAFPGGHPQERAVGFVSFLNKYGPALVDRLRDDPPLDGGTHWILGF